MFALTENDYAEVVVIVAFRGSGKSTIMSLSYPIWAILGKQQKKYPLIICQTQQQSRQMFNNIKKELENNELLIKDFGPFEPSTIWRQDALILPKHSARLSTISTGENIRGSRSSQNRPDLIVCDDVEDSDSVKIRDNRDNTYNWFVGDVIPAGDSYKTKIVVIGNLLHEDALIMRLKKEIDSGDRKGEFRSYPLIGADSKILWPGRFIDKEAVLSLRKLVGNEILFEREYMLNIIPDDNVVINREWIQYYDKMPTFDEMKPRAIYIGTDLAISEKTGTDYTAVVVAYIYGYGEDLKIYIQPHPINKKINYPKTMEELKKLNEQFIGKVSHITPLFLIESVGYQDAVAQQLQLEGIRCESIKVAGTDKRSRLSLTADYIWSGKVLFSKTGNELLIQQMTGFNVERHDDLVDAFTLLVGKVIETDHRKTPGLDFSSGWGETITGGLMDKKF